MSEASDTTSPLRDWPESEASDSPGTGAGVEHPFLSRIAQLFKNRRYSDLEIVCEGIRFPVHKNIVCMLSPMLAKMCESQFKEATSGVIEHSTFGVCTVERMLQWMYTGVYTMGFAILNNLELELADSPAGDLIVHIDVYAIADYYQIPELQKLACDKFKQEASSIPRTAILEVTRAVCACTTDAKDALRQELHQVLITNIDQLIYDEAFLTAISEEEDLKGIAALICRQVVLTNIKQIADLKDADWRNGAQANEISELRAKLEATTTEYQDKAKALENATRDKESCRHCSEEFQSYVEWTGHESFILRCRKCRTRHYTTPPAGYITQLLENLRREVDAFEA